MLMHSATMYPHIDGESGSKTMNPPTRQFTQETRIANRVENVVVVETRSVSVLREVEVPGNGKLLDKVILSTHIPHQSRDL